MTPIISPWVFYAMQICDAVSVVNGIISVVAGAVLFWLFLEGLNFDRKSKHIKRWVVILIVCGLISMLCPTQSTLTKMIVAQNVTYERVEMVGDTVEDIYNDIISLVDNNESEDE